MQYHLFIPTSAGMRFEAAPEKPVDMAAWQAQFVKGGTQHGFRNTGQHHGHDHGDFREKVRVLITGAAGNLGTLLSRHLVPTGHELRLMYHRTPLAGDVASAANVRPIKADLGDPATLTDAVAGIDVIVHFAGRLFAPRPERFLPETNTRWFANLLTAALEARVGRVILTSFPQVEGPRQWNSRRQGGSTGIRYRCTRGRGSRRSGFSSTRTQNTGTTPVVLRLGMIYGRGILMVEAARWLARRRLLCVWKEPTLLQLLSTADFLRARRRRSSCLRSAEFITSGMSNRSPCSSSSTKRAGSGDIGKPIRIPFSMIYAAAWLCECVATVARTPSPLTRDFVRLGRVDHWGDTQRARQELISELVYPTLESGLSIL